MKNKTSIDEEWASLEASEEAPVYLTGQLVSHSIPAPELTLGNFLKHAEGQPRFFWQQGDQGEFYAGFGTATQLIAWGENRFLEIEEKAAQLFDQAQIFGEHSAPILPRLFGGFSFRDDFTADNTWAAFHPAHFVLPHYQFIQKDGTKWLTINGFISETEDMNNIGPQLRLALQARYAYLLEQEVPTSQVGRDSKFEISYPMPYKIWEGLVNEAIQTMALSDLNKVVLARVCELRSKSRIDVCHALSFLNTAYKECTRFLFEPRAHHAFYGATPEVLVKMAGKDVSTMALAGSMPRGQTIEVDQLNAQQLLNSTKERHEHALVVEAIHRRLEPITFQLDVPETPDVLQLSYIQHLLTPIRGELREGSSVLQLVKLLHPTPALGGSPREMAMEFIRKNEPVPRGWYAAPVGWLDSQLDGEFVVAIRSAVAQEMRVWCYAGAGIVPDSQPYIEWEETGLKFQPMLRALNANHLK
jgi:menaquinone-specific isochorismate synthase